MGTQKRKMPVRFSPSEIKKMEDIILQRKGQQFDQPFFQKLAERLNRTNGRSRTRSIDPKEIQEWFENKPGVKVPEITYSHYEPEENGQTSNTTVSNIMPESSDISKDKRDKIPESSEMEFEARSSKDLAWYDVEKFLILRKKADEFEVLVRYDGFGEDEDEWVRVLEAVRERSIPVESSECRMISVGDPVLCFRERNSEAMHFDAHVLDIQRKVHDIRGCRCLFLVRYDHDEFEEQVRLRKLCRRPRYIWSSKPA